MSITFRETRSYKGAAGVGLLDAAAGVATVVLAICGLAGVYPPILTSAAVVVLGVELVARSGMIISGISLAARDPNADLALVSEYGGGLAALLLAGFGGVTLGILALLGIAPQISAAVAVIAFGVAFVLSNGSGSLLLDAGSAEGAASEESVPAIAGLASLVLGVLALVQMDKMASSLSLILVALLILGAGAMVSGGGLGLMMQSLTRPRA
ncbi:hypothetical protein WOC76_01635 [Methylocystis sp. IM3]|uniref:hypothetical protein n=1 Tax=unclassified Methylocystis TaxID=2625913 RepID=UPI0030FC6A8D